MDSQGLKGIYKDMSGYMGISFPNKNNGESTGKRTWSMQWNLGFVFFLWLEGLGLAGLSGAVKSNVEA